MTDLTSICYLKSHGTFKRRSRNRKFVSELKTFHSAQVNEINFERCESQGIIVTYLIENSDEGAFDITIGNKKLVYYTPEWDSHKPKEFFVNPELTSAIEEWSIEKY